MADHIVELLIALTWLLRELVAMQARKKQGYQGRFFSIPPNEADTLRDSPQAKRND